MRIFLIAIIMFFDIFADYSQTPYLESYLKPLQLDYTLEDSFILNHPTRKFGNTIEEEEISEPVKLITYPIRTWNRQTPKANPTSKIISMARLYVGKPYVYGGKSPKTGFDCSGLIGYVYKQAGYDIGMSTTSQFKAGKEVSLANAKVGDIICTPGTGASGRHVKMISKIENGQIYTIEAKGRKYGIVETPLTKTNNIITIRRII